MYTACHFHFLLIVIKLGCDSPWLRRRVYVLLMGTLRYFRVQLETSDCLELVDFRAVVLLWCALRRSFLTLSSSDLSLTYEDDGCQFSKLVWPGTWGETDRAKESNLLGFLVGFCEAELPFTRCLDSYCPSSHFSGFSLWVGLLSLRKALFWIRG